MHPAEKTAWVVILVAFTVLEVFAIRRADKVNEDARIHQNEAFQAIADGLKISMGASKSQYDSTIDHVNAVLSTTQDAVASITGADSYALIVPKIYPSSVPADMDKIVLSPKVVGRHTVWDVRVVMSNLPLLSVDTIVKRPVFEADLGALSPASYRTTMGGHVLPTKGIQNNYYLGITSRGSYLNETLSFRYDSGRWEYEISANRTEFSGTKSRKVVLTKPIWTPVPIVDFTQQ